MERLEVNKENDKTNTNVKNQEKESFEENLINLRECQEEILGFTPNQTDEASKNLLDSESESASNQTAVENRILLDVEFGAAPNPKSFTNKNFLGIDNEKSLQEQKKDLNTSTENCAKVCIDNIKNRLINVFPEIKNATLNQTVTDIDVKLGEVMKTLEEEVKDGAETNFLKREVPQSVAEIGLPKKTIINDALRVVQDEIGMRDLKKIGVYSIDKFKTSTIESSDVYDVVEEDEILQPVKPQEGLEETFLETKHSNLMGVISVANKTTPENMEKCAFENMCIADTETKETSERNIGSAKLKEVQGSQEKTAENISDDKLEENKMEANDLIKKQKSALIKSILKNQKRVTFADKKGDSAMEHMPLHEEDSPKLEETQLDIDTSLRFMTEVYPSLKDEEMLSESFNATLEPGALPRSKRESPLAKELYEELKILEGDDQVKTSLSISPCHSPEKTDRPGSTLKDDKTTNNPKNKFSKFVKSMKKKIWS